MKVPVLVQRLDGLGDVLMALAAVKAFKHHRPDSEVTFASRECFREVVEACPHVDFFRAVMAKVVQNWQGEFHELSDCIHGTRTCHQTDSYLKSMGITEADPQWKTIDLDITQGAKDRTASFLSGIPGLKKIVLVHAGINDPNRTWPEAHWVELVELLKGAGWDVIQIGQKENCNGRSCMILPCASACGMSHLETVALMSRCQLLISNDSGPLHLAGATSIDILGIFSVAAPKNRMPFRVCGDSSAVTPSCCMAPCYEKMSNPEIWATFQKRDLNETFQQWCPAGSNFACMRQITPEMVMERVEKREVSVIQKPLRIAIYTISKNEEKEAAAWAHNTKDADERHVTDTGSTDNTVGILCEHGVHVHTAHIDPWRFDLGRNAALANVPRGTDICISLDMDERLPDGWRATLEREWKRDWNRARYAYAWAPGRVFDFDRIHARAGYRYVGPAHEALVWYGDGPEKTGRLSLTVGHHHDGSKPRPDPMPLLQMGVRENASDPRLWCYLCREHWYRHEWAKVVETAQKMLDIPGGWPPERAAVCRWAGDAVKAMETSLSSSPGAWRKWYRRGVQEAPDEAEAHHAVALCAYNDQAWLPCLDAARAGIERNGHATHYLVEPEVHSWRCHDLAAVAAWQLGYKFEALEFARTALKASPNDARLKNNVAYMEDAK